MELERLAAELPEWCWPPTPLSPSPEAGDPPPVSDSPFVWRQEPSDDRPGPLAGMRLAVKDAIAVAGRPLRAGSASRADAPAEPRHAPIVARLIDRGAGLVGTTRMHELAFGVTGINRFEGTAPNPLDTTRIPGGSSSGSAAAVGMGLAEVALATDTGGSARIPAALCGVVGYKASRRLLTEGVLPLAPILDHLGWCTRTAVDARRVALALGLVEADGGPQSPEPSEPFAIRPHHPRGFRDRFLEWRPAAPTATIGVLSDEAEPPVQKALRASLNRLADAGLTVLEVDWPHADLVYAVSTTIMFAEAARVHPASSYPMIGPDVRARLERGGTIPDTAYAAAIALKDQLARSFSQLLDRVDVVACPTTPITAPSLTEAEAAGPQLAATLVRHTRLDNLTGRPAITLPLKTGGLHLAGRDDGQLLDAALAIEAILSRSR